MTNAMAQRRVVVRGRDPLAVVNPVMIVEVTSDSTEEYARGEKLRNYQGLSSLQEVLFVSHRERRLSVCRREGTTWTTFEAREGQTIELGGIGVRVAVDDVCRGGLEDVG